MCARFPIVIATVCCILAPSTQGAEDVGGQPGISKAEEFFNQGNRAYQENKCSDALVAYEQALKEYISKANRVLIYNNQAYAFLCKGEFRSAETSAQSALTLAAPDQIGMVLDTIGDIKGKSGNTAEACSYYRKSCDAGHHTGCDNFRQKKC